MKKFFAFVLVFMMIAVSAIALAEDFSGWWQIEETGAILYLGEDGMMQMCFEDVSGNFEQGEWFCAILSENGETRLLPFYSENEMRFVQRFAEREGWMDLTDMNGNTTSWLMVTPADAYDPGLEPQEGNPLVGVWSMMSEDLTAPCADFYDDGYFAFEDLMGIVETDSVFAQPLFGRYQLENGLLSLYPVDSRSTQRVVYGEDDTLTLVDESANNEEFHLKRYDISSLIPTTETIIGTWENEESSLTFHANGTIDMAGIADFGTWSLNGCRLIISSDDPIWSFASYVSFADSDETTLVIKNCNNSLTSEYTKK